MSEVKYSQLNEEHRIDAEYFKKEYLHEDSDLAKHKTVLLGDYAFVTDGQHGYYESDSSSKIHMLAARNCKEYFANTTDAIPLAKWVDDKNKRSSLVHGDIILSTRGSVGCCAIVYDEVLPANINQDVARIKLNNSDNFKPEFLIAYMNCKFGQNWMFRNQTGMVQQGLPLDKVRLIPVPMLSSKFQSQIEQIVKSAHAKLAESKALYAEAEEILLSELGLKDWQPKKNSHTDSILLTQNQDEDTKTKRDSVGISNPCGNIANYSIKRFSDFASSGRLDAEYYQSKYDELEEKLSQFQLVKIKDIINYPVCSGSTPKAGDSQYYTDHKNGIPFLRAVDIIQSRVDMSDLLYIKSDVHNGLLNRTQLKKNDVLFSIAGTVGRCGIFDYDFEANINQAIAIIRFDESVVKHLYVIQFFNSKIGQLLIEKYARQGLQTNLNLEEVSNLYLPVISMEIQTLIAEKIQKSFDLRKQSKQLLEQAKRMVEEEIEKQ